MEESEGSEESYGGGRSAGAGGLMAAYLLPPFIFDRVSILAILPMLECHLEQ
jgi:hypothetical protein